MNTYSAPKQKEGNENEFQSKVDLNASSSKTTPKPKKATPKPSAQKRNMLFDQTISSVAKKGEIKGKKVEETGDLKVKKADPGVKKLNRSTKDVVTQSKVIINKPKGIQ